MPPPIPPFKASLPDWLLFVGVILYGCNLGLSLGMVWGGWQMWRLRSHRLAMIGATMALVPGSLGWPFALAWGIWALVVLARPEVREAFEA